MGFSKTYSAHISILEAHIVDVEVDLSVGLYYFSVIGLADKAVEEARDRIGAAIKNSGFTSPKQKNHKVVISLAPATIRKEGAAFDLAMAMAYLLAAKEIEFDPQKKLFLGELSLDGKLRPIRGVLALVLEAEKKGFTEIFLPKDNVQEASLTNSIAIYGADTLSQVISHLNKKQHIDVNVLKISPQGRGGIYVEKKIQTSDFSDVKGQVEAKRVLEIAAVGKHNVMLYGPPGTGKTMLAHAFSSILPKLSFKEMIECTSIHSVVGKSFHENICFPPFRSPHHTASYVSLVGGGSYPKPGEVTLAHRGVLFMDEFPEFNIQALEALREPLESKLITLTRAKGSIVLPADFILIATMNPCPCGFKGSKKKNCICRLVDIDRYRRKLSGPMVDRIDLWTEVGETEYEKLTSFNTEENSEDVAKRIVKAKEQRRIRSEEEFFSGKKDASCLPKATKELLESSARRLGLSPRSFYKVQNVARTIADLAHSKSIEVPHVLEALQYRPKDFLLGNN